MSGAADTTRWARTLVAELVRAGVEDVVVAPGSRSTPLVLAFAAQDGVRLRVHLDERSCGFFALGVGKASGRPAVVITTSGTATANLYPAVVEAARSETPLLVLTADRPHHLRDADANQAIDQVGMYGSHVRASFDLAPATDHPPALAHLQGLAARAVALAVGEPGGPVHLNCPFDKPLEPVEVDGEGEDGAGGTGVAGEPEVRAPRVTVGLSRLRLSDEEVGALARVLAGAQRGLLVAGPTPHPVRLGPAVVRWAAAAGFPVLADPLSGARFRPSRGAVVSGSYDLFLRDEAVQDALRPDLVLRVGASPTSAPLLRYLERHRDVRQVVVDGGSVWKDHADLATDYLRADAADALTRLELHAEHGGDGGWLERWERAEAAARQALDSDEGEPHEGTILATAARAVPEGGTIYVSSSMPVRDLDAFGAPRDEAITVLGNRGASGIDGIVSAAFGAASASPGPTVCVVGDIAFFHDQNGLLWSREADAPVVFVLVDNDGGGIFHMLPVREHEPWFTPYFATPHGMDLSHSAALHGVPWEEVDPGRLGETLAAALAEPVTRIIRVRTDRDENQRRHQEVADAVARSVREALG